VECTHQRNADALIVEAETMSTDMIPISAGVDETVAACYEIISYIGPLSILHMKYLKKPHVEHAFVVRCARIRDGMADNHIRYW